MYLSNFVSRNDGFFIASVLSHAKYSNPRARRFLAFEREDEFVFKGHAGKVPVVGVLVIEGDKVAEWREYYDRAELLEAMGVEGDF